MSQSPTASAIDHNRIPPFFPANSKAPYSPHAFSFARWNSLGCYYPIGSIIKPMLQVLQLPRRQHQESQQSVQSSSVIVSSPSLSLLPPWGATVTPESVANLPIADHSAALQASSAALQQNAAALEQKRAQVMAPVAAVDAKLCAVAGEKPAALASGDSAISMMQPDRDHGPVVCLPAPRNSKTFT